MTTQRPANTQERHSPQRSTEWGQLIKSDMAEHRAEIRKMLACQTWRLAVIFVSAMTALTLVASIIK
ncbi:TPA: hypothetical protein QHO67_002366 [Escherichia coli]|nr:hypothetical protein [Escherichia coli]